MEHKLRFGLVGSTVCATPIAVIGSVTITSITDPITTILTIVDLVILVFP